MEHMLIYQTEISKTKTKQKFPKQKQKQNLKLCFNCKMFTYSIGWGKSRFAAVHVENNKIIS